VFFTIGHSTLELAEFLALLAQHGITQLVDVRKLPGSRRYPHFDAPALEAALAEHGIRMLRFDALTGRRGVSRTVPFATNAWWQHRSFHNYADHALGRDFARALLELRAAAAAATTTTDPAGATAIMCAEAVWWRCHRRIITDYLLVAGEQVHHILGPGDAVLAELSAGARPHTDGTVTYPAA